MDIQEMHVVFRELAQQMGMQNIRAILDEDIDITLNTAIIDKVRDVITQNVSPVPYPDKVIRQNVSIAPINAIRTLYCKANIDSDNITTNDENGEASELNPWKTIINSNDFNNHKVMLYTGFSVSYNNKNLYDCRIIEAEDLGQTLRDFCNRATYDAPIATVFGDTDSITVNLYTGRNSNIYHKTEKFLKPTTLTVIYIKEPAKVHLNVMDNTKNVDCDLPAYLHSEIIERAVSKYLISIGAVGNRNNQQSNNK